jgi:hypothetical protein
MATRLTSSHDAVAFSRVRLLTLAAGLAVAVAHVATAQDALDVTEDGRLLEASLALKPGVEVPGMFGPSVVDSYRTTTPRAWLDRSLSPSGFGVSPRADGSDSPAEPRGDSTISLDGWVEIDVFGTLIDLIWNPGHVDVSSTLHLDPNIVFDVSPDSSGYWGDPSTWRNNFSLTFSYAWNQTDSILGSIGGVPGAVDSGIDLWQQYMAGGPTERSIGIPLANMIIEEAGGDLLDALGGLGFSVSASVPMKFDVTIDSDRNITLNQQNVVIEGLTVNGGLTGRSDLLVRGDVAVSGTYANAGGVIEGSLQLSSSANLIVGSSGLVVQSGTVSNPGRMTLFGALRTNDTVFSNFGDLYLSGGSLPNADALNNHGYLEWQAGSISSLDLYNLGTMSITGSGSISTTGRLVSSGSVVQTGSLSLATGGGELVLNTGVWTLGDGAAITSYGTSSYSDFINEGTIRKTGQGTATVSGVEIENQDGTIAVENGTLSIGVSSNFVGNTLTDGTWIVHNDGSLSIGTRSIATNAADIRLYGSESRFDQLAGLADNQGSLAVAQGREFSTVGDLANSGTLSVDAYSRLDVAGDLLQAEPGRLVLELNARMVSNVGDIDLIIDEGDNRTVQLFDGTSVSIDLVGVPGSGGGSGNRPIAAMSIGGTAYLDGTLDLSIFDIELAIPGYEFTVIKYAGVVGSFDSVLFPTIGPDLAWWWEARSTAFVVGVEPTEIGTIPAPGTLGFGLISLAAVARRSRRS